ncbi:MAG: hypothetical protein P4L40_09860 [Terracidiphilus sp.]|nr:hypothetical protein [Terracidiphilus sp.]
MATKIQTTTDEALDGLTRAHTAFRSFAELTNTAPDYFPTLAGEETSQLADAYDREMIRRGDPRRAWRGTRWHRPVS